MWRMFAKLTHMSKSTRYVLVLAGWLSVGLVAHFFLHIKPGGLAWWLLMGLPAAATLLTLLAVGAVGVVGLFLSVMCRC